MQGQGWRAGDGGTGPREFGISVPSRPTFFFQLLQYNVCLSIPISINTNQQTCVYIYMYIYTHTCLYVCKLEFLSFGNSFLVSPINI